MTSTKELLHALSALDSVKPKDKKPVFGVDEWDCTYTEPAEQFDLTWRWTYSLPVQIESCELLGRNFVNSIDLGSFSAKHLERVVDEITCALRERAEERALARGEYELERRRDRDMLRGEE